jgi:hypothetical protein
MPSVTPEVRRHVVELYQNLGLEGLLERLFALDPAYYETCRQKES